MVESTSIPLCVCFYGPVLVNCCNCLCVFQEKFFQQKCTRQIIHHMTVKYVLLFILNFLNFYQLKSFVFEGPKVQKMAFQNYTIKTSHALYSVCMCVFNSIIIIIIITPQELIGGKL